ncbi:hypothetical protein ACHAW6_002200, partial [Cyclotella cf. meneghiniana]
VGKAPITESKVRGLFELWNFALATGNSRIVALHYTKSPVLLPTVSDQPHMAYHSAKDYFDTFLLKKPQNRIIDRKINIGNGWASNSGIYEFTLGTTREKVKARYSYNYSVEDGVWKIQHHHSSVLPEAIATEPIAKDEVCVLFDLWKNVLASRDPVKVACHYSRSDVLLPTVSDIPHTDFSGCLDYFTNFLKLEPQGKILEGEVMVGMNWAQDAGIYEVTMGATGQKVKGFFTFVYVY